MSTRHSPLRTLLIVCAVLLLAATARPDPAGQDDVVMRVAAWGEKTVDDLKKDEAMRVVNITGPILNQRLDKFCGQDVPNATQALQSETDPARWKGGKERLAAALRRMVSPEAAKAAKMAP